MGENSNYNLAVKEYMASGYSEAEAKKRAFTDVYITGTAMAFAGGAISGGFFGGFGGTTGAVRGLNKINQIDRINKAYDKTLQDFQSFFEGTRDNDNNKVHYAINPEGHSPEMQRIIQDYNNAVDTDMLGFIENARNNKNDNKSTYELSEVSDRLATDIEAITGIDVNGFENVIKANAIRHIDDGHGINGSSDNTMSNDSDIARMQYVIDNYDNLELLPEASKEFRDKNNAPAPMVRLSKRINGTYYVVEAVPDSTRHQLAVITAYKNKAVEQQEVDAMPLPNAQNDPEDTALSNNNVSQKASVVNNHYMQDSADNTSVVKDNIKFLDKLKEKTGIDYEIMEDNFKDQNGKEDLAIEAMYDRANNKMVFAKNVSERTALKYIAAHEVTHFIEGTEEYEQYKSFVKSELFAGDTDAFDAAVQAKIDLYNNHGITLDANGAESEIVADFTKDFLYDEKSINRLAREKPNVFRRIYDFFVELINKFRNGSDSQEISNLEQARKVFEKAMRSKNTMLTGSVDNGNIVNSINNNRSESGVNSDGQTYDDERPFGLSQFPGNQRRGNTGDNRYLSIGNTEMETTSDDTETYIQRNALEKSGASKLGAAMESTENLQNGSREGTDGKRFLEAVNSGDDATANELLNKQAVKNGFTPVHTYNGVRTDEVLTEFTKRRNAVWVTADLNYAEGYSFGYYGNDPKAVQLFTEPDSGIYDLFIKKGNVLDVGNINAVIRTPNDLEAFAEKLGFQIQEILPAWNAGREYETNAIWTITNTAEFADVARRYGYDTIQATERDGVVTYGVLYPENLKSAKLLTYDEQGKIIPLEKRFDTSTKDIRYSISNSVTQSGESTLSLSEGANRLNASGVVKNIDNSDGFMSFETVRTEDGKVLDTLNFERHNFEIIKDTEAYNTLMENLNSSKHSHYGLDTYRAFEKHLGSAGYKAFDEVFFQQFENGKKAYLYIQEYYANGLKNYVVDELGIKPGSKESKLVQMYGEKIIDESALRRAAPDKADNIIKAEKWFRDSYDALIEMTNKSKEIIYPEVEQKVEAIREKLIGINDMIDIVSLITGDDIRDSKSFGFNPNSQEMKIVQKYGNGEIDRAGVMSYAKGNSKLADKIIEAGEFYKQSHNVILGVFNDSNGSLDIDMNTIIDASNEVNPVKTAELCRMIAKNAKLFNAQGASKLMRYLVSLQKASLRRYNTLHESGNLSESDILNKINGEITEQIKEFNREEDIFATYDNAADNLTNELVNKFVNEMLTPKVRYQRYF